MKFANAKRQIKKLQAIQLRSRADQLDRQNQVDVAFFERLKKNHKRTYIEALKNFENQISNIPADKVNVAKRFYEELYGSIPTNQSLQYKFLQHVPRVITSEHREFLCTAISKTEIYNAICEMKNGKTPDPDGISVEFYEKFWHIIGDDFAMILNKFVNCRQQMEWKSFKQAYITL